METKKLQDLSFEARCGLIAKVIHSANRAYVDAIGGRPISPIWEEIREEERQGLIKAVSSMIKEPRTPEMSHEAWCEARKAAGWTKDKVYSQHRKTHPNLIPYAELPFEEQFKDHLFMGIASIFCSALGMFHMPEVIGEPVAINPEDTKLRVVEDDDYPDGDVRGDATENLPDGMPLKEGGQEGPDNVINGVENIYTPVMDPKGKEDEEVPTANGVVISEGHIEAADFPVDKIDKAKEILSNAPADFTAADVADAVFGGTPPPVLDPNVADSDEPEKPLPTPTWDEEIKDTDLEATKDKSEKVKATKPEAKKPAPKASK